MVRSTNQSKPRRGTGRHGTTPKIYPNRIAELTKARGMTYATVGEALKAHEVTIAKLANDGQELTFSWMKRLAQVFDVTPAEIIARPAAEGMRRVRVLGAIQAGAWGEHHEWPEEDRYDVMLPDDPALRGLQLYAGEIAGPSMNLRYQEGTVVIFSRVVADAEIKEGRRYHVRQTRADGQTEETIKTLVKGEDGRFWLRPESTHPDFQEWIPLDGRPGGTIEVLGRVRYAVQREE
jgi:transcriptional regulator with XRE-family HTH domain